MIVRTALASMFLALALPAQAAGKAQEHPAKAKEEQKDATKTTSDASFVRVGQKAKPIALTSMDGKTKFNLQEAIKGKDGKPGIVVITCWSAKCPISKGLDPTVQKIADEYAPKGVTVVGICSNHPGHENEKDIAAWCGEAGVKFPILNDQKQEVAKEYGFRTTPDVFVIDGTGTVAYRGQVETSARGGDKTPYLRNALDAVLANKPVPVAMTKPEGCTLKFAKGTGEWYDAAGKFVADELKAAEASGTKKEEKKEEKKEK